MKHKKLDLSSVLIRYIDQKKLKADVSSATPSSERIKELWVVYALYVERWTCAIGGSMAT